MTERRGEEKKRNRKKKQNGEKWIGREKEKEENDESRGRTLLGTMTPFAHDRDDHPPSSMETWTAPESSFTHVIVRPHFPDLPASFPPSPFSRMPALESHARIAVSPRLAVLGAHLAPNCLFLNSCRTAILVSDNRNGGQPLFRANSGTEQTWKRESETRRGNYGAS